MFFILINVIYNYFKFYYLNFILLYSYIIFSCKIIFAIIFLILMRVGVPRFRYDHLSKLGWLKFSILLLYIFIWFIFWLIIW